MLTAQMVLSNSSLSELMGQVLVYDPELDRLTPVNFHGANALGYPEEAFQKLAQEFIAKLVAPEDQGRFLADLRAAAQAPSGGIHHHDYRFIGGGSASVWGHARFRSYGLPGPGGGTQVLAMLVFDSYDRGAWMNEHQAVHRCLIEGQAMSRIGSYEFDLRTGETWWSPQAARNLGIAYEPRMSTERVAERMHPDDRPRVREGWLRAVNERSPFICEYRVVQPSGAITFIRGMGRPVHDANGEITSYVGTIQDITELRESESRFDQMARLASLGRMAAGLAHEVNNPLLIIRGHLYSLRKRVGSDGPIDADEVRRTADLIDRAIDRIATVTRGFGDLTRSGEEDPLVECSIGEMIEEAVAFYAKRIELASARVEIQVDESLTAVCRPVQIQQVIHNLFANALDAVASREERWVRIEAFEREGAAVIAVTDSGPGVPADFRPHLFEPFATTKAPGKGMGLGLSFSYRIAASHRGSLSLDTTSAQTRFVLSWPKR